MDIIGDAATKVFVDGPGSSLTANAGAASYLGNNTSSATLTVRNGATASFAPPSFAISAGFSASRPNHDRTHDDW